MEAGPPEHFVASRKEEAVDKVELDRYLSQSDDEVHSEWFGEPEVPKKQKSGPVFLIDCGKCQELADMIDAYKESDPDLRHLGHALRSQERGFFQISVAREDFVLWPGGPDVRDFQFGGRDPIPVMIMGGGDIAYAAMPEVWETIKDLP